MLILWFTLTVAATQMGLVIAIYLMDVILVLAIGGLLIFQATEPVD